LLDTIFFGASNLGYIPIKIEMVGIVGFDTYTMPA